MDGSDDEVKQLFLFNIFACLDDFFVYHIKGEDTKFSQRVEDFCWGKGKLGIYFFANRPK